MSDTHDALNDQFARILLLELENRHLKQTNEFLQRAVDLLSMPQRTDDDVRFIQYGLMTLRMQQGVNHDA